MAPEPHQALIGRFKHSSETDTRIAAAFVGGSRAAGTADEHADVDLYLIVRDDSYDDFFAKRRTFMRQFGTPLLIEDFNGFGFDMLLFIYADGVEGELVVARESNFAHIPSGPIQALVDRNGILPAQGFPRPKQPLVTEQCEHLRWLVCWFWRDLSQFSRRMARGQLWSAYGHLEMMRHTCLNLARLKHAFTSSIESYYKLEMAADAEDLACFQRTFCPVGRVALLDAARHLIEIYVRLAPPLASAHGIAYPAELQRVVIRRLEQTCRVGIGTTASE